MVGVVCPELELEMDGPLTLLINFILYFSVQCSLSSAALSHNLEWLTSLH